MIQYSKFKYLNKKFTSNSCGEFIVLEYINTQHIKIKFDEDGTEMFVRSVHIKSGMIKNPNSKNIFNIGYFGYGKYNSKLEINGINIWKMWYHMLSRCYDINSQEFKTRTYVDCSVAPIWHNFQNFAEWCIQNLKYNFVIDKDILFKGNKIYSPETCCFVPKEINGLFITQKINRGKYPIGVCFISERNKYMSHCHINENQKTLGYFNTSDEAFLIYKKYKEQYIKEIADKWCKYILSNVYQAMYNYQVEITD